MGLVEICFRDNIFGIISMLLLCNKSNKARGEEIGWQGKRKEERKGRNVSCRLIGWKDGDSQIAPPPPPPCPSSPYHYTLQHTSQQLLKDRRRANTQIDMKYT